MKKLLTSFTSLTVCVLMLSACSTASPANNKTSSPIASPTLPPTTIPIASPSSTPSPSASPKPSSSSQTSLDQRLLQYYLVTICVDTSAMTNDQIRAQNQIQWTKYQVTRMEVSQYGTKLLKDPAYASQLATINAKGAQCGRKFGSY